MTYEAQTGAHGRLLLIDRDVASAQMLAASLAPCLVPGFEVVIVTNGTNAMEALRRQSFTLVLADLQTLGDVSDQTDAAVARLAKLADGALLIVLSDGTSISASVAAMRAGAHDYIAKPVNGQALAARIAELAQRHGKTEALSIGAPSTTRAHDFDGFIGTSSAMQFVYEQIVRIAPSIAPVFITGETGTGKDACAQVLHNHSPRATKPMIVLNCAAIERHDMESALFGVASGAYSGGEADRKGAAELAHGGTLFLDEIGDMDLSLQGKLLRFLQTGTLSRVGEANVRRVDVRVICATNRNPMQLIAEKKFREDLFYRLHVLPIHLPPLRQRPADIMVLARAFLDRFAAEEHKTFSGFTNETATILTSCDWPGNVGQLQNFIHRLVIMCDGGEIGPDRLALASLDGHVLSRLPAPAMHRSAKTEIVPMWRQEQRIIEDAITSFGGNISLAAAALEISPSTIYRKRQNWSEAEGKHSAA